MYTLPTWLYLANAVLLINHEIDSAYWNEWKLFRMKGGAGGFLIAHFPLLALILYGQIEVYRGTKVGLVMSLVLAAGGVFAFLIHTWFIKKGNPEFTTPVSRFILYAVLAVSLVQAAAVLYPLI